MLWSQVQRRKLTEQTVLGRKHLPQGAWLPWPFRKTFLQDPFHSPQPVRRSKATARRSSELNSCLTWNRPWHAHRHEEYKNYGLWTLPPDFRGNPGRWALCNGIRIPTESPGVHDWKNEAQVKAEAKGCWRSRSADHRQRRTTGSG